MGTMLRKIVAAATIIPFVALTATGCATSAKNVAPSYVSPLQYQSYTCEQIVLEIQRIQARVGELTGQVDDRATKDAWAMGVGMILFWPALFFLSGGNSAKEAELARMKGEYDALQQSAIQHNCMKAPPSVTAAASAGNEVQPSPPSVPIAVQQPVAAPPAVTASQPVMPVATQATLVQTSASVAGTSKYMINAERYAKAAGCVTPVATMTIASPGYEVFTVGCGKGTEPLLVRCDYGVCKTMQ